MQQSALVSLLAAGRCRRTCFDNVAGRFAANANCFAAGRLQTEPDLQVLRMHECVWQTVKLAASWPCLPS